MYQFAVMDDYDHTSGIMAASSFSKTSPAKLHPFRKDPGTMSLGRSNMDNMRVFTVTRGRND